jgi:hypothetical protein
MDFRAVELFSRAARWLQDVLGLEATGIRRPGLARRCYFETELFGQNLRYAVWLDGSWANVVVEGFDQTADAPARPLLTIGATSEGFRTICKLITSLERSGVREIRLPLQVGTPGMLDSWLIT